MLLAKQGATNVHFKCQQAAMCCTSTGLSGTRHLDRWFILINRERPLRCVCVRVRVRVCARGPQRPRDVLTSSHSAPWNTTRLSHSRHLEGALSLRSLWLWAAFDIWALRKGPGELAVSVTISARPGRGRRKCKWTAFI